MMKALVLHQPWASLMATGHKKIETRSWSTDYRGDVAIIAGAKFLVGFDELYDLATEATNLLATQLPRGFVVCMLELFDVRKTDDLIEEPYTVMTKEYRLGDYTDGRYGWMCRNVRPLKTPVRCRGFQKLFNLHPTIEALVRAQL